MEDLGRESRLQWPRSNPVHPERNIKTTRGLALGIGSDAHGNESLRPCKFQQNADFGPKRWPSEGAIEEDEIGIRSKVKSNGRRKTTDLNEVPPVKKKEKKRELISSWI